MKKDRRVSQSSHSSRQVQPDRARLKVVYRRTSELKLDPTNPRHHETQQIGKIGRSIDTFGFNSPILIDSGLNVIAGHGRLLAARRLGRSEVPTIALEHLSEAQKRAFMIADNRLTDLSSFDERLLAIKLQELSVALDLDFSLEATGFEMGEIDLRIQGQTALPGSPEEDAADSLPSESSHPPVSRVGDLWMLGRHRVYCGSALDPVAYATLMDSELAAMVFTDSPYNVRIDGHASGLGQIRHREFVMAGGEMDEAQFTEFLARSFTLLVRHSVDGSIHFQCMDWRHMGELLAAGRRLYSELKNICVWTKHNAGMGSFYRSQHELVFVFKHGRARPTETTSNSGGTGATAAMSGPIRVQIHSVVAPMRAISSSCTQP